MWRGLLRYNCSQKPHREINFTILTFQASWPGVLVQVKVLELRLHGCIIRFWTRLKSQLGAALLLIRGYIDAAVEVPAKSVMSTGILLSADVSQRAHLSHNIRCCKMSSSAHIRLMMNTIRSLVSSACSGEPLPILQCNQVLLHHKIIHTACIVDVNKEHILGQHVQGCMRSLPEVARHVCQPFRLGLDARCGPASLVAAILMITIRPVEASDVGCD